MGDGSKQNEGMHLSVYAFDKDECNLLIEALKYNFELNCTLHHHVSGYRIYIDKNSTTKVRNLVKPYIVPTMFYKLGL